MTPTADLISLQDENAAANQPLQNFVSVLCQKIADLDVLADLASCAASESRARTQSMILPDSSLAANVSLRPLGDILPALYMGTPVMSAESKKRFVGRGDEELH